MQQGTVDWFNEEKGYGFIRTEDGEDVFVHHTTIQRDGFPTLKKGEKVVFELEERDGGLKASLVKPL